MASRPRDPGAFLTIPAIVALIVAGFLAGIINAVVGAGSLITFPVLLAVGFPPLVANVSNTVGLSFGSISAAVGYRLELQGQWRRVSSLATPGAVGSAVGAALLLTLPQRAFNQVVPVLIVLAVLLVIAQPWLSRRLGGSPQWIGRLLPLGVFLTACYGGYFSAAQGVIMISLLGLSLADSLQRLNALKNVITAIINVIAAVIFILVAHVAWEPAVLIAGSSIVGGQAGAILGRRLSPMILRAVIVTAGVAAVVKLLV